MDLRDIKRDSFSECYVCLNSGLDATLWPQAPGTVPMGITESEYGLPATDATAAVMSWTPGVWEVHITSRAHGLRGGRRQITVCVTHWSLLWDNWIQVAADEVALEAQWNSYIERTEG